MLDFSQKYQQPVIFQPTFAAQQMIQHPTFVNDLDFLLCLEDKNWEIYNS